MKDSNLSDLNLDHWTGRVALAVSVGVLAALASAVVAVIERAVQ